MKLPTTVKNKPSNHYGTGEGIEPIDLIKSGGHLESYCIGNIIKYVYRYKNKNGFEDLEKARVYLNWLIDAVLETDS